jgi:hypothetical protein
MGTFFGVLDGREWRVEQAGSQWWLYDRENWAAVVFQREGKRYVVIKPHCIPEQSAPTLEAAFGLAKQLAMWALPPDPDTDRRFRTVNHWDRINGKPLGDGPRALPKARATSPHNRNRRRIHRSSVRLVPT